MLVFDTNVLIYAIDEDSHFHQQCRDLLIEACTDAWPAYLTWNICYEFFRATTHISANNSPMQPLQAWNYIEELLRTESIELLIPTYRHAAVLAQTLEELPDISGNLFHDLHIAVLMREHGVSTICTRDTDFHRFPFLTVVDPMRIA